MFYFVLSGFIVLFLSLFFEHITRRTAASTGTAAGITGFSANPSQAVHALPFEHFNYSPVQGACCENVIGYVTSRHFTSRHVTVTTSPPPYLPHLPIFLHTSSPFIHPSLYLQIFYAHNLFRYIPIPVGVAGPLMLDDKLVRIKQTSEQTSTKNIKPYTHSLTIILLLM